MLLGFGKRRKMHNSEGKIVLACGCRTQSMGLTGSWDGKGVGDQGFGVTFASASTLVPI